MVWELWFIAILSIFVAITFLHSLLLPSLKRGMRVVGEPLVSILVPMRNEQMNVKGMVSSLKKQTYPNFEVLILDDESTDGTRDALNLATYGDNRFRIVTGSEKPEGWIGKVYACHQLGQQAKGEYLLYIDADVRIEPAAVETALAFMQRHKLFLLSGFSRFLLPTWLNQLLVPMQHFIVLFHLPIALANWTKWPAATAAHGGFMFFERTAYEAIGGHESVHSEIVEDVAISKRMKANGYKMWLANITEFCSCTMYETNEGVWKGFSKNIYNGLGRSVGMATLVIILYVTMYVFPAILLVLALFLDQPLWLVPYALITLQALIVYRTTREPLFLAFLLPASALALVLLLGNAMRQSLQGQQVEWKGRFYG